MLRKILIITTIFLAVMSAGLLVTAYSFDHYVRQHPEIYQALGNTNGNPELIKQICSTIHLPRIAQGMNFFVPLTFFAIVILAILIVASLLKHVPRKVLGTAFLTLFGAIIVFVVVQVWEPDFQYVMCGLV